MPPRRTQAPATVGALPRLFQLCASTEAAATRALVRPLPLLADWWAGLEGARFLVSARLRSPYGGPAQTFEALERMLQVRARPGPHPDPLTLALTLGLTLALTLGLTLTLQPLFPSLIHISEPTRRS
eukprot:6512577-Prymnesium_polylepis.1